MKQFLFVISFLFLMNGFAQQSINWMTFEEAMAAKETKNKPILIDMYTDWCGWCKRLDATTFKDPSIVSYVNANYYAVKFDAEGHDTIEYKGKKYFNPGQPGQRRSTHQLTYDLMKGGRMSYPTIVYFDEDDQKHVVPGYMEAKKIQPLLIYIADQHSKALPFDQFNAYFDKTFYLDEDSLKSLGYDGEVNWLTMQEAFEASKKTPKKWLISITSSYSNADKMMAKTTFTHPKIADYLNENYYAVQIDALTQETITAFGQEWTNPGPAPSYHSLAVALLEQKMEFPSLIFMNEEVKLINRMQFYASPETIEPILHYFGDDAQKETPWLEYKENFQSALN